MLTPIVFFDCDSLAATKRTPPFFWGVPNIKASQIALSGHGVTHQSHRSHRHSPQEGLGRRLWQDWAWLCEAWPRGFQGGFTRLGVRVAVDTWASGMFFFFVLLLFFFFLSLFRTFDHWKQEPHWTIHSLPMVASAESGVQAGIYPGYVLVTHVRIYIYI